MGVQLMNEAITKVDRLYPEFKTNHRNWERHYGRGVTRDEIYEMVQDPETKKPLASRTLSGLLHRGISQGDLAPIIQGDEIYYWSPRNAKKLPKETKKVPEVLDVYAEEIEEDPYPPETEREWEEIRYTTLEPLTYDKDYTPYGNYLPRWDVDAIQEWSKRNEWQAVRRVVNKIEGFDHLTLGHTRKGDQAATIVYQVVDTEEKNTVGIEGVFRRGKYEENFHPPLGAQDRYLAKILMDVSVPERFAKLNEFTVDLVEEVDSSTEAGAYKDLIRDTKDMRYQFREKLANTQKASPWINLERQAIDLFNWVADKFGVNLNDYVEMIDLRPTHQNMAEVYDFLVEDIVRDDSDLKRRNWVQEMDDRELLDTIAEGRKGGKAAKKVKSKWEEYLDAFERRLDETVQAKLK